MKIKTIEMAETQKGIYFDCQLEKTSSYHISASVLLENADEQCLENALKILVHEQEALRSAFDIEDGLPVMHIHDRADFNLRKMDISKDENQKLKAEEITRKIIGAPFELSKPSLFRAALLKTGPLKHILILCCHHLISDGISMGILVDKLLQYQNCLCSGKEIEVKTDSGFADFITGENKKLSLGGYQKHKRFWGKKLLGAEALELQADYADRLKKAETGREKRFILPDSLFHKAELLSMEHEVTLFTFFLSAFQVLMAKYTRSEDIVVSSPFTYRPDFDLEETIGCFVHMLPVRSAIRNKDTFAHTLTGVQKEFLQAYKNIGYPNNLIMRDSFPAPAPGRPSIYDISFVYDCYEEMQAGEVKASILDQDYETFSGNMMVILNQMPGKNQIKVQYKPELYKEETIEYLGQRYLKLLECICENIEIKNEDIDLFLPGERERIVREYNQSSYFEYKPGTVIRLLQEKAARFPERTAFLHGTTSLTYKDVNQWANRLAALIKEAAKGEKQVIGIMLDRYPELAVSIYGVLKSGCAYVPIDPSYPDERIRFILEDAAISQVIASENYASRFPDGIVVHNPVSAAAGEEVSDPEALPFPHDLAYIEYTSGSTGQPKGVMIEHHSLLNTLLDLERRFPVKEGDVYLLKTAFSFDVSGTEIYGWFMGEGTLLFLEAEGEKDPEKILTAIERYQVTHINFVPSMFRIFLQLFEDGDNLSKLRSLKWIFVGGEAVTPDMVSKFCSLNTDISLENVYGPTECTIWASHYSLKNWKKGHNIPIGSPLNEIRWYVVDEKDKLLPMGIPGELCLSGAGLARGYLNREELTEEKFCLNPFFERGRDGEHFEKMYRTGDLVRRMPDGNIEFMGRIDFQVKINGVRLELGEIENAMAGLEEITQAVVLAKELPGGASVLCAYYSGKGETEPAKIRDYLSEKIPSYMIPSFFVYKSKLPLNGSGKIDQKALRADQSYLSQCSIDYTAPETDMEKAVANIWQEVLSVETVGLDEPFFEKGGHSVALMEVHNRLKKTLKRDISIIQLFQLPTVRLQAEYLSEKVQEESLKPQVQEEERNGLIERDIAIIGMSVHVPGADSVNEFWDVLKNGQESIHFYEDDELRELGISEELIQAPNYVKAKGRVNGIESFDPKFFRYSPADVKMMPPQLRLLYKGAWEAFEDAGYYPGCDDSTIGVFVGGSDDFEWYQNTIINENDYGDRYQSFTFGTNHFLATRLAYKLDLKGPVYTALTGCSTSLVTPHLACQSLISEECDMALAGGVTVELPNEGGYLYEDGMMFSPDGHLRPFDERAKGTVFSNGMGLLILKRLSDAVRDRDHIYAVIKGSAINNDGSRKVGFAAPSVEGQVDVIRTAYRRSGIDPETVSYVEAHGTGTSLGDPIEVESLTEAFGGDKKQYCTLGSVKGNVGHADSAAGIVGLEKAALSLSHSYLPATVNYELPNRKIDFCRTPFVVKNYGEQWTKGPGPRRAGVNSFGIGGTNAHMILEEAPSNEGGRNKEKSVLMVFSAKSEASVKQTSQRVIKHLLQDDSASLSDAAWTLQIGRKEFPYRKALAVGDAYKASPGELLQALEEAPVLMAGKNREEIYFMFTGQGNQYQGMGLKLYKSRTNSGLGRIYADYMDEIFRYIGAEEKEYREVLFGSDSPDRIHQTKYSQIALFAVEYAMAKTLLDLGIRPKGLIGHSIGEVAAAAVAGVWSLEDAVKIVLARGKIMQMQEPGVMTAVMADGEAVKPLLVPETWISLRNTTGKCVVGGHREAVEEFEKKAAAKGFKTIQVKTSHAFHTPMMDQAACEFEKVLMDLRMEEPSFPILSNLSGNWSSGRELTDPSYWAKHITHPVDFESNLSQLLKEEKGIFLEIGGGRTLCTFAMQHADRKIGQNFINLMRHPRENKDDLEYLLEKLGNIWCLGVTIDWRAVHKGFPCHRVSLPSYVFDETYFPVPCSVAKRAESKPEKEVTGKAMEGKQNGNLLEGVQNAYGSVFGYENIGADENFFDLGGDSLRSVSLAAAIRNELGVKVDVADIFNAPTPGALAAVLGDRCTEKNGSSGISPAEERAYYPLSSAQSRMYSLYQFNRENTAYNLPSATIITGTPDKARLDAALNKLAKRHEALRTSFEIRDGQAVQIIHPYAEAAFTYENVMGKETEIPQLIREFVKPFDLEQAPLFRAKLIQLEEEKHLLLFDFHHIIADGTSVEVLSKDFGCLYEGDLGSAGIQYKDYSVWQQENLKSEEIHSQRDYWMERLSGELPVLELPTDYERPRVKNYAGGRIHFKLEKELVRRLQALAHDARATNYMTMLSAWYTLLARYSGQEDIIVGTPVAGRSRDEIRETVGMFVNMLAMRNYPSRTKTFTEFLSEVRDNSLDAFQNQDYQFDVLTEQLKLKRELDRNALFDVCFDYQNMEFHELKIDGLKFTPYDFDTNTASYDLILTCQETSQSEIECFIDYSAALFCRETIERMISHFVKILEEVTENPGICLREIDLITEEEWRFLCETVNNTELSIEDAPVLQAMFEGQAMLHPEKIALITADGTELTYQELNEKANCLAWNLIDRGIHREELVGIMPARDQYLFVSILGILKAGAAYVPIDPAFPKERIAYMLENGEIHTLVCPETFGKNIGYQGAVIDLSRMEMDERADVNPQGRAALGSLACVIYTSGSTGNPKGVMINQESMVNFVMDIRNRKIFTSEDDRVICVTTISFDIFGFESITPLCTGNSVYLADESEQLDPALAGEKIRRYGVTHLLSTVSRIKAFVDNPAFGEAMGSLRCILSGGENYPLELLHDLKQRSSAKIYNMYGPTETTIWSTAKELTHGDSVNIGRPIANTRAYILNESKRLLPVGVYGELCLAGKGLARGYWKRPEETADKFITIPGTDIKVYRTGDRARILPWGEIELSGRLDSQVKIRGYRVELGEIEKMAQHKDEVNQAAVIVYEDGNKNKQLAMFYNLNTQDLAVRRDSSWLKKWLEENLPAYMVPSRFILKDRMPTLPNGKLNKKALSVKGETKTAAPVQVPPKQAENNVDERDFIKVLQEIWQEVLAVERVGIRDNFFDIGGNSLGLILVNNKISRILGQNIPLMKLFENPTIESLAKSLGLGPKEEEIVILEASEEEESSDIAVIGMACRFPGASDVDEFWNNIVAGKESVTELSDEELLASGIDEATFQNPDYVKRKGFLEEVEYFDAEFFQYSQKEAEGMDPQMRLLHQCAWNTLENGGYDSYRYKGKIGLFAGSSSNALWMARSLSSKEDILDAFETMTLNEKDFLTTKISYKLNLTGPSMNIQSACSTSLVAVHQAVQSLLKGESDMALAGGVSVTYPRKEGYLWHEGMIFSRDGHCRPFSEDATGTIPGNGCALVLLKPLKAAEKDGDTIYAVIKGSAVNNDGLEKIGYTAPGIAGQSRVIEEALRESGISPEEISYLEAHGTGTKLGDPIEVEALKQAYKTNKRNYCALGSVKANIGHLDAAAGIAGFIKSVLTVYNRTIPPLANFGRSNKGLNIEDSPFYVTTEAKVMENGSRPMNAGISSFGIGGTNVHVIISGAQKARRNHEKAGTHTLIFSAKNRQALDQAKGRFLTYMEKNPFIRLSDAAWTLQKGRGEFEYRTPLTVRGEALDLYSDEVKEFLADQGSRVREKALPLVFLFSEEKGAEDFLAGMSRETEKNRLDSRYHAICQQAKAFFIQEDGLQECLAVESAAAEYGIWTVLEDLGLMPEGIICPGKKQSLLLNKYKADGKSRKLFVGNRASDLDQAFPDGYLLVHICQETKGCSRGYDETFLAGRKENYQDCLMYFHRAAGSLWSKGYPVRWEEFLDGGIPKRIPLPGYAFEKKCHESDVSLDELFGKKTAPLKEIRGDRKQLPLLAVTEGLKTLWQDALGCENPHIEQDFFEAGGHSLTAINLAAKIKERFGVDVMLADMFDHSTLGEMAGLIHGSICQEAGQGIPPVPRQEFYETSSAQKRMYAASEMLETALPYNLASVYIIKGELDQERWRQAFQGLTDRHESFRTRFELQGSELVQIIEDEVAADLDFGTVREEEAMEAVKSFVRPFDLSKAPLFRGMILTVRPHYHILAIDMHHIISDQSSIAILLKEFETFYKGGKLSPLKVQYKDFVCWQNRFLESGEAVGQIDYWKKELEGDCQRAELKTDFVRNPERAKTAGYIRLSLGETLSGQIIKTAKEQGITPYMLLLASLKVVLWKMSGRKDQIVGTGIAGRRHSDLEPVVGMFVNTLAVRSRIESGMKVSGYLQNIRKKMVNAYDNQDCQFETLLEHLDIKTDPSRNPLFDIMFNYINMGTEELSLDGLVLEPVIPKEAGAKFDITCTILEHEGMFKAEIEYDKDLYRGETIELLGRRLSLAAKDITEKLDEPICRLCVMTEEEKELLILCQNNTAIDAPLEKSVETVFEETVKQNGEKTAVVWKGEDISYDRLNRMADLIAGKLKKAGLGYQDRAALLLDRSPVQIAAILGVLKCGGIYIPIDPEYPQERIDYILKDSGCSLAAVSGAHAGRIKAPVEEVLLEEDMFTGELPEAEGASYPLNGDDLIYIMYTSGSTGNPKGTLLRHKNVIRMAISTNYVDITPHDHIMQLSNYAFDGSVFDIFGALLNGAALYLAPKETCIDMELLSDFIRSNGITVSFMTAALFHVLADWDITALKGFKTLLVGGDVMSPYHAERASDIMGPGRLANIYGPTETAVFACCYKIGRVSPDMDAIPIGYPISGTSVYVLDEDMQPVPPGVAGELYIGGAGVGAGYLNREDLTKEKFLTLPEYHDRVYRTGDKVMHRADGALMFLGRMDFQVKIRGFRVELGEIEKQIGKLEGIKEVVVKDWKDQSGSMYLAAYCMAEEGIRLDADRCREQMLHKLPDYMVPSRWKQMEQFTLTSNGKIDRKALPLIDSGSVSLKEEDKPGSKAELKILGSIRQVLDQAGIGVNDNFFDRGGQSIKAIALVQALSREGIRIKVNEVFQNPTARELARLPEVRAAFASAERKPAVQEKKEKPVLSAMSSAQTEFLAAHMAGKNRLLSDLIFSSEEKGHFPPAPIQMLHASLGSDYSGFTDYIDGALTEQNIKEILWDIVKDNQLLHSAIKVEQGGEWVEYSVDGLEDMITGSLPYMDISMYTKEAREALIRALQKMLLMTPYEKEGLPWRLCCLRLSEEKHFIIWGFDHTAFDGMSAEIIRTWIERKAEEVLFVPEVREREDEPQTYDSYVKILEKGPNRISEDELIESFSLKKWNRYNDKFMEGLAKTPDRAFKKMVIKIPLSEAAGANPWWHSFDFISMLLRGYAGKQEIPLGILDYGRGYGKEGFYNCVGEFLDIVPVVLKKEMTEEEVTRKLASCSRHYINFLSLVYDKPLSRKYKKASGLLKSAFATGDSTLNMALFNFQGFVSKREEKAFEGAGESDKQNTRLMITVNYDEDDLNMELACRDGLNYGLISDIICQYSALYPVVNIAC